MIVKFQRSINPTGRVLAYSRDYSIFYQGALTKHLRQEFGDELKIYLECEVRNKKIVTYNRVENQDW